MKCFEVYDEVTNKTLLIKATSLEQALEISETISFDEYENMVEVTNLTHL